MTSSILSHLIRYNPSLTLGCWQSMMAHDMTQVEVFILSGRSHKTFEVTPLT